MNGSRQFTARKHWYQWLRWGDLIVAVLIAVLAVALLRLTPDIAAQPSSAILTQDGQILRQWTSSELAAGGEQSFIANGYHYKISWQNNQIRFIHSDCPDQVCVQSGWISRTGAIAACVPGNLILKTIRESSAIITATHDVDVVVK